jgi:putative NIF3 family GTP cyclohydrolase 1 type 2
MKLKKIISALEAWAPPAYQEPYDNSRLLAGDPEMTISGVLALPGLYGRCHKRGRQKKM